MRLLSSRKSVLLGDDQHGHAPFSLVDLFKDAFTDLTVNFTFEDIKDGGGHWIQSITVIRLGVRFQLNGEFPMRIAPECAIKELSMLMKNSV